MRFGTTARSVVQETEPWLPLLGRHKPRSNPLVVAPPASGGTYAQFRDPTTAWRQDGLWYTAIGVQANCIGGAAMYSSPDLRAWTYVGQLASQLGINATAGLQCSAPPVPQPGNGACDQMGADCHTWARTLAGPWAALFIFQGVARIAAGRGSLGSCTADAVATGHGSCAVAQLLDRTVSDGVGHDVQECPDYFSMDYGVSVLKWSDQVPTRACVCPGILCGQRPRRPAAWRLLPRVWQGWCERGHALRAGARPHALCRRLVHAVQR